MSGWANWKPPRLQHCGGYPGAAVEQGLGELAAQLGPQRGLRGGQHRGPAQCPAQRRGQLPVGDRLGGGEVHGALHVGGDQPHQGLDLVVQGDPAHPLAAVADAPRRCPAGRRAASRPALHPTRSAPPRCGDGRPGCPRTGPRPLPPPSRGTRRPGSRCPGSRIRRAARRPGCRSSRLPTRTRAPPAAPRARPAPGPAPPFPGPCSRRCGPSGPATSAGPRSARRPGGPQRRAPPAPRRRSGVRSDPTPPTSTDPTRGSPAASRSARPGARPPPGDRPGPGR